MFRPPPRAPVNAHRPPAFDQGEKIKKKTMLTDFNSMSDPRKYDTEEHFIVPIKNDVVLDYYGSI